MALTAMTVVFSCLLLLLVAFKLVGKFSIRMAQRNAIAAKGGNPDTADMKAATKKENQTPGEVFAAIAMALHEEMEDVHDVEEMVITMNMEDQQPAASPWGSKSLMMRHTPIRRR
jgi:Na+-transporting methylmalonyl-CoA/oxaloacetate decarboxylase gamma subunit